MRLFLFLSFMTVILPSSDLSYLNDLRQKAGLNPLVVNELLNQSASNHARYLDKHGLVGHDEKASYLLFTGEWANDRASRVGYKGSVLENISTSSNAKESIDNLFSAIYHRFAFLNLHIDEIGLLGFNRYRSNKLPTFVYNMGNSYVNKLCAGNSYQGYGTIYRSVCSNKEFKIHDLEYLPAHNFNAKINPSIVVWPYAGAKDIPTAFYEEIPDPLPHCRVSGYPISIEFNPLHVNEVSLLSFKLYDAQNNAITAKRVLSKNSDPHHQFSAYQFAFMPLKRLEFETQYRAKVLYFVDGKEHSKEWSFETYKPKYPILEQIDNKQKFEIISGQEYLVYLKPKNCKDIYRSINSRYIESMKVKHHFVDNNTIYFKVVGKKGQSVKCRVERGRSFELRIK